MYIPRHFELPEDDARALLASATTAQLVTAHARGPVATLLPVVWRPSSRPGGHGSLWFHLTRTNGQWKDPRIGDALAILSGPDAYVDPAWDPDFADHPGVPTWNYVTVHAYGPLVVHDGPDEALRAARELGERFGYDASVMAEDALERMARAIVGVELAITRIEAKAKLSQNRSPAHVAGVAEGLHEAGEDELAAAMEELSLPHARARYELISGLRAGRQLGEVGLRELR